MQVLRESPRSSSSEDSNSPSSESKHEVIDKVGHAWLGGFGGGDHVDVAQRRARDAGGEVGDERDAGELHAARLRHHRLGHGGHADDVRALRLVGLDLRRRLVGGAGVVGVDAVHHPQAEPVGAGVEQVGEVLGVDRGHVREALAPVGVVRADERSDAGQVDVVAQDHEVAGAQRGVDAAGGVGEEQRLAAHAPEHLDRQHHRLPARALVPVAAAAPGGDEPAAAAVEHELAGVALHGGSAEAGDVGVGYPRDDLVGPERIAPAAAEHNAQRRRLPEARVGENRRGRVECLSVHGV